MNVFASSITEAQRHADGNLPRLARRAQLAAAPAESITVLMPNASEQP